jgi:hypothetical protein
MEVPHLPRPFRLPVNQAGHVRVEGLSRLGRYFATRFAIAQFAWILRQRSKSIR